MTTIDWGRPGPEPRVEEMLRDPIVQLIMRRDRLSVAEVMAAVTKARGRLQAAAVSLRDTASIRFGGDRAHAPEAPTGTATRYC